MNRAIADRLSREYLFCHTTLEVVAAEDVVRQHVQIYACSESSQWTQTDPSSATSLLDLLKPVAHHRQPDGVLKRVVVVLERLLRVERGST
jgi:hypothetical protein